MTGGDAGGSADPPPAGCAWAMVSFNALVMGVVALGFTSGPYSSLGQELWYRYGSLAFLTGGALLPALLFAARPSRTMAGALLAWMIVAFCGFAHYVLMSGGGV